MKTKYCMNLRELFTGTKPSTCKKYAGNPSQLGKSARDSCKSQGLIARNSKRKHRLGKTMVKIDGKKNRSDIGTKVLKKDDCQRISKYMGIRKMTEAQMAYVETKCKKA